MNRINDDSRKGAKDAKHKQDYKFKARNPKFETNPNGKNPNVQNHLIYQFRDLVIRILTIVSDFDIRISDFKAGISMTKTKGTNFRCLEFQEFEL